MATERLHFERSDQPYHAFEASAHLARYGLARDLVPGRRVLDIACGEGYGALLMRRWGAAQVVGADNAPDAIAVARRRFADPMVEHICCDALDLLRHLNADARFDLVVSFETVEHLPDPASFLRMLAGLLAPGGAMMVSCPNDPVAYRDGGGNPFHLARYSFDQFRRLCEEAVGPVTQWMVETPGVGAVQIGAARLDQGGADPPIMCGRPLDAVLLPAQAGDGPGVADCLAYVAIWGAEPADVAVLAPTTLSAFLAPWRWRDVLDANAAELARLYAAQQADRRQLLLYAAQIDHARGQSREQADAAAHLAAMLAEARAALDSARCRQAATDAALGHERRVLAAVYASTSWRLTAPLRVLARWLGIKRKVRL